MRLRNEGPGRRRNRFKSVGDIKITGNYSDIALKLRVHKFEILFPVYLFRKSLRPCALDVSSLSIGRVKSCFSTTRIEQL